MKIHGSGYDLLNTPLLNKGTAFTEQEREKFGLHGLLPPTVASLDEQVARRLQAFRQMSSDYDKHVFLRGLQDSNEVLFYALLVRHIEEMLSTRRPLDWDARPSVKVSGGQGGCSSAFPIRTTSPAF